MPGLTPGQYRVTASSTGMQTMVAGSLSLQVGSALTQNFTLAVAAQEQTIQVTGAAPVITSETVSVGTVINQQTVQEIPLNGRHFIDLSLLTPGSVTPLQNGFLTAPLRGQGSFAFNTAGNREDQINYMINGINLNDPLQNQITFQPTINTVQEFRVDNSTYSAEYGRNSGAIVNIATRSGTNDFHGELYEFLRNSFFDGRIFANPSGVAQSPFKAESIRGGWRRSAQKDKALFYLSYEGLIQRQSVPLSTAVLTDAQRAQATAQGDPVIQKLLPLIPVANSPGGFFVSSAVAPVDIHQGTANVSYNFSNSNRANVYYAIQHDLRDEPPTTQGNNLPGFGDTREGRRQLLTLNDTDEINSNLVNEARLGFNRIHNTFSALNTLNAADFGINSGVNSAIGLPQISVRGAFALGGINNFPQGRGDYTAAIADTLNWVRGKHSLKFGDQANAFTANPSNRASRIFVNSIGALFRTNINDEKFHAGAGHPL